MNRLKQEREQKGLSLRELQKEILNKYGINLGSASISNYERGIQEPKKETWETLADYFNVSTAYLMGLEPYRTDEERRNAFSRFFYVDEIMSITEEPTPFGENARTLFEIFSEIVLNLDAMADGGREPEVLTSYLIDVLNLLFDLVIKLDLSISDNEKDTISSEISDNLRIKREIDQSIDSILMLITDSIFDNLPET